MCQWVRRAAALAVAVTLAGVTTACGGSDSAEGSDPGSSDARTAPVDRPYDTALQAALGFSQWFAHDSDQSCNQLSSFLDGRLPQNIVDTYSCRKVLTAAQLRDGCDNAGGGASDLRHVTVTPGRLRYTVRWNLGLDCASGHVGDRRGTYQVIVQKYADGWAVTSYKVLTGPGAGTSG